MKLSVNTQECLRPLYTRIQWNEIYLHAFFFDYPDTYLQSLKETLKPVYIPQIKEKPNTENFW